jgi:hypothetical protein
MFPSNSSQAIHLYPGLCIRIQGPKSPDPSFSQPMREAARLTLQAKRQEWAALSLRQDWADASFMRAHLKEAGLVIGSNKEPATAARLRSLLFKAGVRGEEIKEAVGMSPQHFLDMNPNLPLWAAVALVLEATGRFTPTASHD